MVSTFVKKSILKNELQKADWSIKYYTRRFTLFERLYNEPELPNININAFISWVEHSDLDYDEIIAKVKED